MKNILAAVIIATAVFAHPFIKEYIRTAPARQRAEERAERAKKAEAERMTLNAENN